MTYLRIKENPAQSFGLPDCPNDGIYPQTVRHKADFLKRSIVLVVIAVGFTGLVFFLRHTVIVTLTSPPFTYSMTKTNLSRV